MTVYDDIMCDRATSEFLSVTVSDAKWTCFLCICFIMHPSYSVVLSCLQYLLLLSDYLFTCVYCLLH